MSNKCVIPTWTKLFIFIVVLTFLTACQENMRDQPRYEPLEESTFFQDRQSSRPIIEDTVPRSRDVENDALIKGRSPEGALLEEIPVDITLELLQRGQERYDIFCSPCHGFDGAGQGMVIQRGFSPPASFHIPRLQESPPGYYFNAITNGFGRMFAYDYRIKPEDRWAITAYIRALQFSQQAPEDVVPPEQLQQLQGGSQ